MALTLQERLETAMRFNPAITAADIARACGIKPPSVSDWMSGKTKSIKGKNLLATARLLGVRPEWLETGVGSPRGRDGDPVSESDATLFDASKPALRRIRIEGARKMNEQGFWEQGDRDSEETSYPSDDPEAYAIRVTGHVFQPVLASGQCLVVSPGGELKKGRPALVIFMDGRRTLRNFLEHEHGAWSFTKVTDSNDYDTWEDDEVAYVERVMAYIWTD